MSLSIRRPTPGLAVALMVAVVLALLAGVSTGPTAHAAPDRTARLDPLDPASLTTARGEADRLRASLDRIAAQQDAAEERLAYVRDQLAGASTRAITTEQNLALLTEQTASIGDSATERVRALYMSGGGRRRCTRPCSTVTTSPTC